VCVTGIKLYRLVAVTFGLLCILQVTLNICLYASVCLYVQKGWVYFSDSIYYISSTKKTWQDSRNDCLQKVIDGYFLYKKDFTRQSKKNVWIGLTDSETEGTWKWVDGTPLTTSYWASDEPNNIGPGNTAENCGEVMMHQLENNWNDLSCDNLKLWICEIKLPP
uniref:C-type lectin domain-containing protein n=1 Tax=Seriola lalandi dorsalis TaxID=1841481 RepID=A0A3B4XQ56_SERLL